MFTFNHTPHTNKKIVELVITSLHTNIVHGFNYRSISPLIGPTSHEHITQSLHVILVEAQFSFVHLTTPIKGNYLPI